MNYKKIVCDEYNIHIIKNKKFHTIDFRVCFTEIVDERKLNYRNALSDILSYATKKYDTKKELIEKCQELYSISPRVSCNRFGRYLSTKFGISMSNSKYIDKKNIIDNILLMKEILLNPLIIDGGFKKEYFEVIRKELENEALTIKEDPRLYANLSLVDMLDEGKKELLSCFCNIDILKEMDEKKLYEEYLKFISESKIDIYISGNIQNEEEIIQTIKDNYVFYNHFSSLGDKYITQTKKRNTPLIIKETGHYQQSKLSMGFKLYNLTEDESKYTLFVLNNLLGGDADSYLMRYVREENNLCYYVGSFANRLDNILVINAGINKDKYELTSSLIIEIMQIIKEGRFTKTDLAKAITGSLIEMRNIEESNAGILDYYYGLSVFKTDDLKTKIEKIKSVTKDDIIRLAQKINLDSIFFLEGDL